MKKTICVIALLLLVSANAFSKQHTLSFGVNMGGSDLIRNQKMDTLAFVEFAPNKGLFSIKLESGVSFIGGVHVPLSLGFQFRTIDADRFFNVILGVESLFKLSGGGSFVTPLADARFTFRLKKFCFLEVALKCGYNFSLGGDYHANGVFLSAGAGVKFAFDVGKDENAERRKYDEVYYQTSGKTTYIIYNNDKNAVGAPEEEKITMTRKELDELLEAQRNENLSDSLYENYGSNETESVDPKELIKRNTEKNMVDVSGHGNFFGAKTKYVYRSDKIYNVYCTIRNITDIRLKGTEEIINVKISDPLGDWSSEVFVNVEDGNPCQHVLFKPNEINIKTDCEIFTTERTYMLRLISTDDNTYQPIVEWVYTAESLLPKGVPESNGGMAPLEIASSIENCVFNYRISGKAYWKPKMVFSDRSKTYIQFPNQFRTNNLAPMVVLRNIRTQEETNLNILVSGITYVLPVILEADQEFVLISGQERVTIQRDW